MNTTTTTRERPVLFSDPMVRALNAGQKTQTRRVVKPQPPSVAAVKALSGCEYHWMRCDDWKGCEHEFRPVGPVWAVRKAWGQPENSIPRLRSPYRVGDVLWVREAWCGALNENDQLDWSPDWNTYRVHYRADGNEVRAVDGDGFTKITKSGYEASPWKPSIHMPHWAARIFLRVTEVRVERVQEISEEDAQAEGVSSEMFGGRLCWRGTKDLCSHAAGELGAFRQFWDSINAKRGHSWESNPWVWAYTFERLDGYAKGKQ